MSALATFANENPFCWLCEHTAGLEIHHICGRRGKDQHDLRNLFRICSHCHRLFHDGSATERTITLGHILYAKRFYDPQHYDPAYLASLRGKKHLGVDPVLPDWWTYHVEFVVDLRPVPQPRHRITRKGPPRAYVPSDHPVHEFRSMVAKLADASGAWPTERPVEVEVVSVFARPKSHMRRGMVRDTAPLLPKADVDNLAKSVMDALSGVAYSDDTNVRRLVTEKHYGTENRVFVKVSHAQ